MNITSTGFLRHIKGLNAWNPAHFYPFQIAGCRVGYLKPYMRDALTQWPEYFLISEHGVELNPDLDGVEIRSQILDKVVRTLVEQEVIAYYQNEIYPITMNKREQPFALLDRAAAGYFGIRTFGQHLNGYVKEKGKIRLWVARRAADRIHFPNKLDNLVAGGLPQNLSLEENLKKECQEEAAIPTKLVNAARSVGTVSYCCETKTGIKPDTLHCYDLALPGSFSPQNTDGEVAEFRLMELPEVVQLVRDTDDFKANCNLVIIDFLIRHGEITPREADYLELVRGLRPSLPV